MSEENKIEQRLRKVIERASGRDMDVIQMENKIHDLGLDSLDIVEVVIAIEYEFKFHVPEQRVSKWFTPDQTFGNLVEHVTAETLR